ncbi:MAG: HD domain-containing phosphohydrolase, partial [Fusobacteriaceae bacterium]
ILNKEDNKNKKITLSAKEKAWIESYSEKKIPLLVPEKNSPYLYVDNEGEFKGVYYDYLQNLERNYGLKFEINRKNTIDFTNLIDKGDQIIVLNASQNYIRRENYTFLPLHTYTSIVLIKKHGKEFDKKNKKRIGITKNSTESREYSMNFTFDEYEKVFLENIDEGIEKLENEEIDFLLGKSKHFMVLDMDIDIVERFSDIESSLAIGNNYPELFSIFEKMVETYDEKKFLKNFTKHVNIYTAQLLKNSEMVKEVKKKYEKIVVEVPDGDDYLPLFYTLGSEFKGFIPAALDNMSKMIDIPIEIVRSSSSYEKHVKTFDFDKENPLSVPYYKTEVVVIGKVGTNYTKTLGDLKNKKIGIVINDETQNSPIKEGLEFVIFKNTTDALKAVIDNHIDYVLGDFIFLDSKIQNMHLGEKLKILGILDDFGYYLSFSFKEEDKILHNLFSRIFPEDITEFSTLKSLLISPKIINRDYYYFGTVVFVLLGILGTVLLFLRSNISHRDKTEKLNRAMISSFEMAAAYNDEDTGHHIVRVTKYSELIAKEIKLSASITRDISRYASLHDIGKIGIPDCILKKPGKLTEDEMIEMRKHPDIGCKIVKTANLGKVAENIVKFHHERWDGNGYPFKISGKKIPIEARVVAIADVYDALRQKRSYKTAYSHDETVQIIVSESETFFDPKLIDVFLKLHTKFDEIFNKY